MRNLAASLVICTYNRAEVLPRCLAAAQQQTLPADVYEVIVVDNASTDYTRQVVESSAAGHEGPEIRYVFQAIKGLSHARNAGARAARGPIVAYIDDDAIAHPQLLARITETFRAHPDAGAVGGQIQLKLPGRLPAWYTSFFDGYYSKFDLGCKQITRVSEVSQYPFGANIAFLRDALQRIRFFNTRMGRIGKDCSGGEEMDAACRIAKLGYGIYYNPFAVVEHVIFPSRLRWRHIANTARAAGRNWAYYETELFHNGRGFAPDIASFLATCKQMMLSLRKGSMKQFCIPYSQHLFYRAKLARKFRYRLRFERPLHANRLD